MAKPPDEAGPEGASVEDSAGRSGADEVAARDACKDDQHLDACRDEPQGVSPTELGTHMSSHAERSKMVNTTTRSSYSQCSDECDLTWRQKLCLFLEEPDSSRAAHFMSQFVLVVIVASIAAFVLQSLPSVEGLVLWLVVDIGSFAIFLIEYMLRLLVCDSFHDQTRWQFVKSPANIVDLLSLLPIFIMDDIEAFKPLRALRAIRLVRVFRVFKLSKYSVGMNIMLESLLNSARPLSVLVFLLGICVFLFSSLVYHAEKLLCPNTPEMLEGEFLGYRAECEALGTGWSRERHLCCDRRGAPDDFASIASAFWWASVTMTSVGYGDQAPRTFLGRAVGCVAMITGIVLISLPVAIVGSKFQQAYKDFEQQEGVHHRDEKHKFAQGGAVASASEFHRPEQVELINTIKGKLRKLEEDHRLHYLARNQVPALLEMFDHLDRVDDRLAVLRERDFALDMCMRKEFAMIARGYTKQVLEQSSAT